MALNEEEQDELIDSYKATNNKKEWRKKVTKLIRENPDQYKVLEMGKASDHKTHLTMTQFENALPSLKKPLIEAIFQDIDDIDDQQGDGKVKITTIVRWVNNKKRVKEKLIIKDENWLYTKLKKFQFKDLDIDENGTLDRDEMHTHFDKEGVDPNITDIIFNNIDANGDGDISIKEWFQWQQKFKKAHLAKLFPKDLVPEKKEPEPEPEPEPQPEPEPEYNPPEPEPEPEPEPVPEYQAEPEPEPEYKEPEEEEQEEVALKQYEMTDNPPGKTNSWSRSQSIDLELDDDEYAADEPKEEETPKKEYAIKVEKPPEDIMYPEPPEDGQEVFIRSPTSKWRECEVAEVLEDGKKWKIHYKGFSSKYDEIIEANSDRLTLQKPAEVVPKRKSKKGGKKKEDENRIWCESANNANIHRECVICDEKEDQYKIHFMSYHERYDVWIEKNSSRLKKKRPRGDELLVGDNLSCYSTDFKGWLEVEVIKLDSYNDRIQLKWVGSNNLEPIWLPLKSNKLSIRHKKHDASAPS